MKKKKVETVTVEVGIMEGVYGVLTAFLVACLMAWIYVAGGRNQEELLGMIVMGFMFGFLAAAIVTALRTYRNIGKASEFFWILVFLLESAAGVFLGFTMFGLI